MLLFASVTTSSSARSSTAATDFISSTGLPAVFLLMTLESACIPIPSEAIMLFAGSSVADGDQTLFGVVAAGVLGNMVGSWITYAVGYYGRIDLLEKNRLIHISPKHLDMGRRLVRALRRRDRLLLPDAADRPHLHLAAGGRGEDALLALHRLTAARLAPLGAGLALIGRAVGENWEQWRDHLHYLDYLVVAAIVALIVYLLVKRRGGGPGERRAGAEPAGTSGA